MVVRTSLWPDNDLEAWLPLRAARASADAVVDESGHQAVSMSEWGLSMLIGELSRSFNHGELGTDEEAVLTLCERLEYAEQTGDGDLDPLMR